MGLAFSRAPEAEMEKLASIFCMIAIAAFAAHAQANASLQPAASSWDLLTTPSFNATADPATALTAQVHGDNRSGDSRVTLDIDALNMAPTPVPEPSTYAMIGLGATLLLVVQRFRRQ